MSLALFHLSAAAINSYVMWYDQTYIEIPLENEILKELPLKSRCMFLTIWCLAELAVVEWPPYGTDAFLHYFLRISDKMSLALFHLSAAAINSYVLWYDQTYIEIPLENELLRELPMNSRSMFLTIWCLVIQTVYHLIAFLNDIFGSTAPSPKKKPVIRKIKDILFSLAFPIALYVSTAFWGIYAVDKDLIFPDHIEKLYPTWMNHVMHSTVAGFMFIELLLTSRNYPSRAVGISIITAFIVAYITWFLTIYFNTGAWVYPVFEPLNWPLRIVFLAFSYIIVLGFYITGEKLNYLASPKTNAYANGKTAERSPKKKR